jgi:2-dehydro-3-deoxygalactonokinase
LRRLARLFRDAREGVEVRLEAAIPDSVSATPGARLIGVDWGTSNVRVMRLADGGRVLEQRADPRGAGELSADAFAGVLAEVAGDWLNEAPVLVCGMAGARGKWREAGYRPCPASLPDIAGALVKPDEGREVFIVPGVSEAENGALSDVMRGEETQMMGLWGAGGGGWAVAPGTHSKWIRVDEGRILAFRTFVTGELFAAVGQSAILSGTAGAAAEDEDAFRRGVERGLADPAVTASIFSARVGMLAGRLDAASAPDYLSGLLIGSEIGAQRSCADDGEVTVVGAPGLSRRYGLALEMAGFPAVRMADAAAVTATGLWRIWEART